MLLPSSSITVLRRIMLLLIPIILRWILPMTMMRSLATTIGNLFSMKVQCNILTQIHKPTTIWRTTHWWLGLWISSIVMIGRWWLHLLIVLLLLLLLPRLHGTGGILSSILLLHVLLLSILLLTILLLMHHGHPMLLLLYMMLRWISLMVLLRWIGRMMMLSGMSLLAIKIGIRLHLLLTGILRSHIHIHGRHGSPVMRRG
mmetsp:Transcript_25888/g.43916  ORF Transcript_25888/g.43916 Transcript_25888/m.43916 type:complete len:201 (+) Transcript_25888:633-1235(+)